MSKMYNYNHGVAITHIEALSIRFTRENPLLDWILAEIVDSVPINCFDVFEQEITTQLENVADDNYLKKEILLLKYILEYASNSNYTYGIYRVEYDANESSLEFHFLFHFHDDAQAFLIELWDYLDTKSN